MSVGNDFVTHTDLGDKMSINRAVVFTRTDFGDQMSTGSVIFAHNDLADNTSIGSGFLLLFLFLFYAY